ncbi:SIMPL domain-containing protein [Streptomyces sp. NPDC002328]|uniref:SIMPL domain-containing protein n=1 Tax=Streptomyces sp. NPDC002328 TaxID=3364642 RepID=UPI00369E49D1
MSLPHPPHRLGPSRRLRLSRRAAVAAGAALLALVVPAVVAVPASAAAPGHLAAPALSAVPAHTEASAGTVTVTGEGSASAAPDLAVVAASVEATAPTPQRAVDAQSRAARALLEAVHAQGVADRDVRTENVALNPVYDYPDGAARLKGYEATQSFSVKVRDVERTGAVLQAITDATGEAGRIGSVVFEVSDPAPLQARARRAAHDDAHDKAQQYAELSGHRLGRLVSLSEGPVASARPMAPAADALGAAGGVPVAPGVVRTTATVTAVYELT